jgi:hypothetical protein
MKPGKLARKASIEDTRMRVRRPAFRACNLPRTRAE